MERALFLSFCEAFYEFLPDFREEAMCRAIVRFNAVLAVYFVIGHCVLAGDSCVECHKRKTPNIVKDWELSQHHAEGISCRDCHGTSHKNEKDSRAAGIPTPEVCADCHSEQVEQFKRGKHAFASKRH